MRTRRSQILPRSPSSSNGVGTTHRHQRHRREPDSAGSRATSSDLGPMRAVPDPQPDRRQPKPEARSTNSRTSLGEAAVPGIRPELVEFIGLVVGEYDVVEGVPALEFFKVGAFGRLDVGGLAAAQVQDDAVSFEAGVGVGEAAAAGEAEVEVRGAVLLVAAEAMAALSSTVM